MLIKNILKRTVPSGGLPADVGAIVSNVSSAKAIADAINEKMGGRYTYKYDRSSQRAARDPNEIGIQSVRGGSIVGIHDLLFCGEDEVIEIKHTAYSRNIFAKGALQAAEFLKGKESGLYDMSDVIG